MTCGDEYILSCLAKIDINEIFLLQIDEWENLLERIGRGDTGDAELQDSTSDALELRFWASYRGQTLAKTGRLV